MMHRLFGLTAAAAIATTMAALPLSPASANSRGWTCEDGGHTLTTTVFYMQDATNHTWQYLEYKLTGSGTGGNSNWNASFNDGTGTRNYAADQQDDLDQNVLYTEQFTNFNSLRSTTETWGASAAGSALWFGSSAGGALFIVGESGTTGASIRLAAGDPTVAIVPNLPHGVICLDSNDSVSGSLSRAAFQALERDLEHVSACIPAGRESNRMWIGVSMYLAMGQGKSDPVRSSTPPSSTAAAQSPGIVRSPVARASTSRREATPTSPSCTTTDL